MSQAAYVLDTEDFLYRPRKARKELYVPGTSNANGASNANGTSNGAPTEIGAPRGEFYKMMCC